MINIIEKFRKNKNLENAEKQAAYLPVSYTHLRAHET